MWLCLGYLGSVLEDGLVMLLEGPEMGKFCCPDGPGRLP